MRQGLLLMALALVPACHGAREPAVGGLAAPEQPLRLETVRFYEAGIGYFERAGTVSAGDAPALFVPEAHLDDALRTLVVFSADRAVKAEFESTVPPEVARVRASLPLPPDDGYDRARILKGLLDAEVEVETPSGAFRGRLIGVDDGLTIAGPDGVRSVAHAELGRIRPIDPEVRARLDRALDRAPERARARYRALHGLAGAGPLRLGYIAETPLWEVTYRLFLSDSAATSRLVGSALVHNDTNEPWSGVRATFASDRPESYAYDFSWPAYLRRTRVERFGDESLLPQLGAPKFDDLEQASSSEGRLFSGKIRVPHRTEFSSAKGSFEYRVKSPIDVGARGSALVPLFDSGVGVRPIVWATWERPEATRALRFENSTEQTLPGGSLSAFAANGFVGETILPRLPPREHAFLELAEELDVSVEVASSKETSVAEGAWFDGGLLAQRWRKEHERTYVVENRKATPVSVYLWLPFEEVPHLEGFDRVEDGNTNAPAGVIEVGPKSRVERKVTVEARTVYHATPDELLPNDFRELAKAPVESATIRSLTALATLLDRILANAAAIAQATGRIENIDAELESIRSDASALGGSNGQAPERIVTKLLAIQADRKRAFEREVALQDEDQRLRAAYQSELERLPKPDPNITYVRRRVRKK